MNREELIRFYGTRKNKFSEALGAVKQRINLISNARLLVALLFVTCLYFAFSYHQFFYALPLLAAAFAIAMRQHGKLFQDKAHLESLVKINSGEGNALQGNFNGFPTGEVFSDPHHPYVYDLDVFGDGSLYQYTNRCTTFLGSKKFANRLQFPLASHEEIVEEQKAVQELAGNADFRQHIQASGKEIDEQQHDREQLRAWLQQPTFIYGRRFYQYFLLAFPILTLAMVVGWMINPAFRPFAFVCAASQWAFLAFHIKGVNAFYDYISRKKNILQKYAGMLALIQSTDFSAPRLKILCKEARNAGKKVDRLASLVHAFDARSNIMTTLFANSLLMYDLQCVYRLEQWKEENSNNLEGWLDTIGEMEVVSSLATFAFNHPNFNYPTIQSVLSIEAREMAHPLISPEEAVPNDVAMGEGLQVLIVTGANMAGKSTFLRTLGVNLILALNGAPVNAKSFSCPVIQLRTGMRTADSLKDHQSYFYAELDRLKSIMEDLKNEVPLLILLDEILKGTNSTDKLAGSIALVKQLLEHPCLAIIATHDLALGKLQEDQPDRIRNFCFEANIEQDQLSFDYKLKPGLAQKMNATFLMKKMGIIPS